MNEQLQKFIEWLPQNIEEFKDKSADEIAQILNQLSQTDEGKQQLNQLMEEFNSSVAQFRAGGKFASFVKKFRYGGSNTNVLLYGTSKDPWSGRMAKKHTILHSEDPSQVEYRYADDRDTV